jgi:hypothetical protein
MTARIDDSLPSQQIDAPPQPVQPPGAWDVWASSDIGQAAVEAAPVAAALAALVMAVMCWRRLRRAISPSRQPRERP